MITLTEFYENDRFRITRTIAEDENSALGFEIGEIVFRFDGNTYGCIDFTEGVPISKEPNEGPFQEVPYEALEVL